jgi:hypothetical protein
MPRNHVLISGLLRLTLQISRPLAPNPKMGNKHSRRPSNKASITPTKSFKSFKSSKSSGSGVSPKPTSKDKATANASSVTNTGGDDTLGGTKDITDGRLKFRSWKTGTLDSTAFQPPGYSPRKIESATVSKGLSTQSSEFVPAAQVNKTDKEAIAGSSDSRQTSHKKPQNLSDGVKEIQNLIYKMQAFPAYNVAHPAIHLSDVSFAQSNAAAVSVTTSGPTTSFYPVKVRESIVRVDFKKKDFIISANGAFRNRFHVDELELVDGKYIYQPKAPFDPTNAFGEIADLCEAGKEHFWVNHHVEIIVDLCGFISAAVIESKGDSKGKFATFDVKEKGKEVVTSITIIDQLAKLGKDFLNYTTRITVDLIFPPPRAGSVAVRPYGARVISSNAHFGMVVNTAGFEIIQKLIAKLDNCVRMEFLEVIIYNPSASSTIPFTIEQLLHALPFYDLRFEHWKLKWQGNYMSTPVEVGNFPIIILDNERKRWLWHQNKVEREAKIAARKEQERIDNMVWVTKSIAPEWQRLRIPEPLPIAPNAQLQKQKVQGKKAL